MRRDDSLLVGNGADRVGIDADLVGATDDGVERRLGNPGARPGVDRRLLQASADALTWFVAMPLALYLRLEGNVPDQSLRAAMLVAVACGIAQVGIGIGLKLYRGRYRFGSFDEVFGVTATAAMVTILATALRFAEPDQSLPRTVPVIAGAIALVIMLGGRFTLRARRDRRGINTPGERTLIYGAGDSGEQLVRQMVRSRDTNYTPVGFIDDDPRKRNLVISGRHVLGSINELERIAQKTGARVLVVAIAGVSAKELLELDRRCTALKINLRVIPSASEIVGGAVKLGDISHVSEEDLLGRRPVHTDEEGIREFLEGKRVLITGAGGSIGSELSRQVQRYHPAFVGMLDRDESALHAVQLSIDGQGLLSTDALILADIRDEERMHEVMQQVRPDIVFHAAALKHLPLLERYPQEAHKTNVLGTMNVLNAARAVNVAAFVNISTDKAADPVSTLGRTKLQTERLTSAMEQTDTEFGNSRYLSVRFGNVLGSRGSVLTAFRYQIEKGGPVTVTHPEVTRYFMTIPEAVHLVLQAAVIGDHGETLILDMGEPIRIADVAQQMIAKSGRNIEIVYTGLRPGEKLEEILVSSTENAAPRRHPLISHTRVSPSPVEAAQPGQYSPGHASAGHDPSAAQSLP